MNIYDNPEKFGLEQLCELNEPDLGYEFNSLVVWRDKTTGQLYYAEDSGCSCPYPFEDYDRSNINPLTLHTNFESFERAAKGVDPTNAGPFVQNIRRLLCT